MVARRLSILLFVLLVAGCTRKPTEPRAGGTVVMGQWFQTNGPSSEIVWGFGSAGNALVAGTPAGIMRSTDLGASWSKVSTMQVIHFVNLGGYLYAGAFGGVLASYDAGATWSVRSKGLPQYATVNSIATDGTRLFAGLYSGGMYRSTNGGASWSAIDNGLPPQITPLSLFVHGSDLFLGSDQGRIFRSRDGGDSWTESDGGFPTEEVRDLIALGSEIFASAGNQGIYVSADDGATWTPASSGVYGVQQFAVAGTRLFAVGYSGLWSSEGGHGPWTPAPELASGFLSMASHSGSLFLGTAGVGVMRCADLPAWTAGLPPGDPILVGPPIAGVPAVAELTSGQILAGTFEWGLFRTADQGGTWKGSLATFGAFGGTPIYRASVFARLGTHRFAASQYGIARSDDDGESWVTTAFTLQPPKEEVVALVANDETIVAAKRGFGPPVLASSDLGETWVPVAGLPASPQGFAGASNGTHFFLAVKELDGATAMYRSADGLTWSRPLGMGLPAVAVDCMAASGRAIYAGTESAGVYVSSDEGVTWHPSGLAGLGIVALTARDHRVAAIASTDQVWLSADDAATWAVATAGLGTTRPLSVALGAERWYAGTLDRGVWSHPY